MTVHKSQGSEFRPRRPGPAPPSRIPLLTRELLYTALTRSRHGALAVGQRPVLEAGTRARMRRFSGLRPALGLAEV